MRNFDFGAIGQALAEALKGEDGPLYAGITAICSLVLGWKVLETRYRIQSGDRCIEPSSCKDALGNSSSPDSGPLPETYTGCEDYQ